MTSCCSLAHSATVTGDEQAYDADTPPLQPAIGWQDHAAIHRPESTHVSQ
jgi:hypothetical protein